MGFFKNVRLCLYTVLSILPLLGYGIDIFEHTVEAFWLSLNTQEEHEYSLPDNLLLREKIEKLNDKGCYFELIEKKDVPYCEVKIIKNLTVFSTLCLREGVKILAINVKSQQEQVPSKENAEQRVQVDNEKPCDKMQSHYGFLIQDRASYILPLDSVEKVLPTVELQSNYKKITISSIFSSDTIIQFTDTMDVNDSLTNPAQCIGGIEDIVFELERKEMLLDVNVVLYIGANPTRLCFNKIKYLTHDKSDFKKPEESNEQDLKAAHVLSCSQLSYVEPFVKSETLTDSETYIKGEKVLKTGSMCDEGFPCFSTELGTRPSNDWKRGKYFQGEYGCPFCEGMFMTWPNAKWCIDKCARRDPERKINFMDRRGKVSIEVSRSWARRIKQKNKITELTKQEMKQLEIQTVKEFNITEEELCAFIQNISRNNKTYNYMIRCKGIAIKLKDHYGHFNFDLFGFGSFNNFMEKHKSKFQYH